MNRHQHAIEDDTMEIYRKNDMNKDEVRRPWIEMRLRHMKEMAREFQQVAIPIWEEIEGRRTSQRPKWIHDTILLPAIKKMEADIREEYTRLFSDFSSLWGRTADETRLQSVARQLAAELEEDAEIASVEIECGLPGQVRATSKPRPRSATLRKEPKQFDVLAPKSAGASNSEKAAKPPKEYKTPLGRNIHVLRYECGWSYRTCALAVFNNAQRHKEIAAHENGRTTPSAETLTMYAEAFGQKLNRSIPVAQLLGQ